MRKYTIIVPAADAALAVAYSPARELNQKMVYFQQNG